MSPLYKKISLLNLINIAYLQGELAQNLILVKNISVVGVVYGAQTERDPSYGASFVQEAADLFRQGRVKPHIGKIFPLSEAAEAMDALLSRSYAGKIILTT